MTDAVAFLAAVVAIIAGAISGVHWLADNAPRAVLISVMVAFGAIGFILSVFDQARWNKTRTTSGRETRSSGYDLSRVFYFGCVMASAFTKSLAVPYIQATAGVLTIAWLVHLRDLNRHKDCPECAERVKTAAKVCHWCGHRFSKASLKH